jgi:hypothetical protein
LKVATILQRALEVFEEFGNALQPDKARSLAIFALAALTRVKIATPSLAISAGSPSATAPAAMQRSSAISHSADAVIESAIAPTMIR